MLVHFEERFVLLDLLYEIDGYIPLSDLRKLYEQVYISEDEVTKKGLYIKDGKYGWKNDNGREIHFPPNVKKMIRITLEDLNKTGDLDADAERLYELFCGG